MACECQQLKDEARELLTLSLLQHSPELIAPRHSLSSTAAPTNAAAAAGRCTADDRGADAFGRWPPPSRSINATAANGREPRSATGLQAGAAAAVAAQGRGGGQRRRPHPPQGRTETDAAAAATTVHPFRHRATRAQHLEEYRAFKERCYAAPGRKFTAGSARYEPARQLALCFAPRPPGDAVGEQSSKCQTSERPNGGDGGLTPAASNGALTPSPPGCGQATASSSAHSADDQGCRKAASEALRCVDVLAKYSVVAKEPAYSPQPPTAPPTGGCITRLAIGGVRQTLRDLAAGLLCKLSDNTAHETRQRCRSATTKSGRRGRLHSYAVMRSEAIAIYKQHDRSPTIQR